MKNQSNLSSNNLLAVCGVVLAMVILGAISRVWMLDWPNFKPVAAIALFAGFYFSRIRIAFAAIVLMMLVSDLWIGIYDWQIAAYVYGAMIAACLLGYWVSKFTTRDASNWRPIDLGRLGAASLTMSTVFYVLTNFGVWSSGFWYERSWAGLGECFVAAIPFFRSTICGDLCFTGLIFAGYWAVCMLRREQTSHALYQKHEQS